MPRRLKTDEACRELGITSELLFEFIRFEWLSPEQPEAFDEEDMARARLIVELREDLGVNDEAIPIILHLLDQIHALRSRLKKAA